MRVYSVTRGVCLEPAGVLRVALVVVAVTASGLAQPPAWWAQRDVIALDLSTHQPLTSDDYAVVNAGQLKNIATKALQELEAHLPGGIGDTQTAGGTGYQLSQMVAGWQNSIENAEDYSAINLGQLKAVTSPFYARLIEIGYCSDYPWSGGVADNYAVANLGQLKNLFAFDVTRDSDGDGIPDWWEVRHGLNPNDANDAGQLSQDGQLTNLQKYLQGLNPAAADSDGDGIPDAVEIANGTDPTRKDAAVVGLRVTGFTAP